jgi:2-(1,2-epoxy-1,2-dihydrophenyl)acetyl-CoA isomerase
MFDEIRQAIEARGAARAILITGAGRAFCAGGDLAALAADDRDPKEVTRRSLEKCYNPAILAVTNCPLPVICAVQGAAAGMGCSLALAADFCLASEDAYFLQAYVRIGRVLDGGASWLLPRLIGAARAREMTMLGERVPASTALTWGLIHRVVPLDTLWDEANSLATRLASAPTVALGAIKGLIAAASNVPLGRALEQETEAQCGIRDTIDQAEGTAAFLEKREPRFLGQ